MLALDLELRAERIREGTRLFDSLRMALSGHRLELALLDHMANGVSEPPRLAELVDRPVTDIYRAVERIRRYALRIADGTPSTEEGP